MPEDFEELLKTGFLEPPEDFTNLVMERIGELPLPDFPAQPSRVQERIQWITLIGAGLVAATQLAAFVFGIWAATAAG